jgi:Predicted phosphoglycerate mutase, AP superfamily
LNTLFILLDGAEDHDIPQFGNKRPLDVAEMPFFRSAGKFKGKTSGRGYTHLFLNEFFSGVPPEAPRAAIEALGLGMCMNDRTAYRLSPAWIRNGMVEWEYNLDEIRDKIIRSTREHLQTFDDLEPEITFFLSGRAILTMKSDEVPETPAPPVPSRHIDIPGRMGAFVDSIARELNGLTSYPWGCGKLPENRREPFISDMTAISNSPTALGVSVMMGYKRIYLTDIEERFIAAKKELENNNVFLHIDEVDEYSHQKDPSKKVGVLEFTDRMLQKYFTGQENIVFFVDHGTSSLTGEHILMDVPFWTSFEVQEGYIPLNELIPTILNGKR